MERYEVVGCAVGHGGSRYEVGEVLEAGPEDMAQLLSLGIVAEAADGGESPPDAPEPGSRAAAVDAAVAAMAADDPRVPEHWTAGGKPDVRTLRVRSGLADLSAQERDEAWARREAAAAPDND